MAEDTGTITVDPPRMAETASVLEATTPISPTIEQTQINLNVAPIAQATELVPTINPTASGEDAVPAVPSETTIMPIAPTELSEDPDATRPVQSILLHNGEPPRDVNADFPTTPETAAPSIPDTKEQAAPIADLINHLPPADQKSVMAIYNSEEITDQNMDQALNLILAKVENTDKNSEANLQLNRLMGRLVDRQRDLRIAKMRKMGSFLPPAEPVLGSPSEPPQPEATQPTPPFDVVTTRTNYLSNEVNQLQNQLDQLDKSDPKRTEIQAAINRKNKSLNTLQEVATRDAYKADTVGMQPVAPEQSVTEFDTEEITKLTPALKDDSQPVTGTELDVTNSTPPFDVVTTRTEPVASTEAASTPVDTQVGNEDRVAKQPESINYEQVTFPPSENSENIKQEYQAEVQDDTTEKLLEFRKLVIDFLQNPGEEFNQGVINEYRAKFEVLEEILGTRELAYYLNQSASEREPFEELRTLPDGNKRTRLVKALAHEATPVLDKIGVDPNLITHLLVDTDYDQKAWTRATNAVIDSLSTITDERQRKVINLLQIFLNHVPDRKKLQSAEGSHFSASPSIDLPTEEETKPSTDAAAEQIQEYLMPNLPDSSIEDTLVSLENTVPTEDLEETAEAKPMDPDSSELENLDGTTEVLPAVNRVAQTNKEETQPTNSPSTPEDTTKIDSPEIIETQPDQTLETSTNVSGLESPEQPSNSEPATPRRPVFDPSITKAYARVYDSLSHEDQVILSRAMNRNDPDLDKVTKAINILNTKQTLAQQNVDAHNVPNYQKLITFFNQEQAYLQSQPKEPGLDHLQRNPAITLESLGERFKQIDGNYKSASESLKKAIQLAKEVANKTIEATNNPNPETGADLKAAVDLITQAEQEAAKALNQRDELELLIRRFRESQQTNLTQASI